MDVDGILGRMRLVCEAKNDTELAAKLNLSISAPSNWRQRNSPPLGTCAEMAVKKGISLDWLIFGTGDMYLGVQEDVPTYGDREAISFDLVSAAERITQFVKWWYVNRSHDEVVWLEQQFKRAVPEYAEWLVSKQPVSPAP
jgi:hypothetical protein